MKAKAYYLAHRDSIRQQMVEYGKKHKDAINKRQKEQYAKFKDARRPFLRRQGWINQGITDPIELTKAEKLWNDAIFCDLCNEPLGKNRCIDHDHRTGKVRGILHTTPRQCNVILGMARDSPDILIHAAQYLSGQRTILESVSF